MAVPTYDKFIEPVLRFLKHHPEGIAAKYAHEGAAEALGLDDNQRSELISSGQLVYKNRAGWAHDRLKRAGLSQSVSRGKWCLTEAGFEWIKNNPFPLTKEQVAHLAFGFMNVKLKTSPDTVMPDGDTQTDADNPRLVLIDGNRLVNLMMDNEIGVSSKIIKLPKPDMDYFE